MTSTPHSTIAAETSGVTLINVYEVLPEKQRELARLLSELTWQTVRQVPGFVSVNIHCSLDGTRVVNYAQWASRQAFETFARSAQAQTQFRRFAALAERVSPVLYRVDEVIAA